PVDVRRGQPLLEALDLHVGIERADRLARRVDLRSPEALGVVQDLTLEVDRKSTRLNSSHGSISYAVFCLKKKSVSNGAVVSGRRGLQRRGHDVSESPAKAAGHGVAVDFPLSLGLNASRIPPLDIAIHRNA